MNAQRPARDRPSSLPQVADTRKSAWAEQASRVAEDAASDAGGLDPDLLGDFLERLAEPTSEHHWDHHIGAAFAAQGARAAEQGVVLRALVDLYLSAAWRAWSLLPEVQGADAAALRAAGQRVLRLCDDTVAALAEGYTSAGRSVLRREASARREFVDDLLAGTGDPASLLERAESYGLALAGAHTVLLAAAAKPFHEAGPILGEVAAAVSSLLGAAEALVTTRTGQLVIVLPALEPGSLQGVLDAVEHALTAGQDRVPQIRLALGRARPGPSGVARSFTEAGDALALAQTLGMTQTLVRAQDLLIYQVLLRDRAALTDLIATVLTPLRQARGGPAPLLDTLEAYLDTGGNTTRAARQLHLSVRAVTYRLHRIASLTGLHPTEPAHQYTLHTALLGARALGWPDTNIDLADPAQ